MKVITPLHIHPTAFPPTDFDHILLQEIQRHPSVTLQYAAIPDLSFKSPALPVKLFMSGLIPLGCNSFRLGTVSDEVASQYRQAPSSGPSTD